MDSEFSAYRARARSLESLMEGQNWFLNQIDGRDSTETYHDLLLLFRQKPVIISHRWRSAGYDDHRLRSLQNV